MEGIRLLFHTILLEYCLFNALGTSLFYRRNDLKIIGDSVNEVFESRGRFDCASNCARTSYCRSSAYDAGMYDINISI